MPVDTVGNRAARGSRIGSAITCNGASPRPLDNTGLVPPGGYDSGMDLQFTAVFRKVPQGYIGFVEELPGANTQGATLEEARANLHEAVEMVLQANRELSAEASTGTEVIREPFKVSA